MAGHLQPLDQKFSIVDSRGTPTDYFIRWAQQRQLDIADGITQQDLIDYLTAHILQEGSGIQITPDGQLPHSPTIAADVQEILDQITATQGAILYRGLLGWAALLPGTAGFFLKTNGAGADPTWAAAAASSRYVANLGTLRPLTDFTQDNTNANRTIVENSGKAISMKAASTAAAVNVHGLRRAIPAAPYRVAIFVQTNNPGWTYYGFAGGWSNGTAHHLVYDQSQAWEYAPWTASNNRGGVTNIGLRPIQTGLGLWVGLREDTTTWYWEISGDGGNFHVIRSMAKVAGYNQIYAGMFSYNNGVDNGSISILDYDENGLTRVAN